MFSDLAIRYKEERDGTYTVLRIQRCTELFEDIVQHWPRAARVQRSRCAMARQSPTSGSHSAPENTRWIRMRGL